MAIDLFQSRRSYNEFCKWWKKSTRNEPDELVMKRIASGTFWAKEEGAEQLEDVTIAGSFMFDSSRITIKTPDNIWGIEAEDLVLYQGEKWIVNRVQKYKSRNQQTLFANDKHCSHYWYLELRK